MIFHLKDGGAIRTQHDDSNVFECGWCATTWTEKPDVWQDATNHTDVLRTETFALDVAAVQAMPPRRDPKEPRKGVVVEKAYGDGAIEPRA